MIVWGSHSRTINLGNVDTRFCQVCGQDRPFSLVLRYSVFGFFWVFNWVSSKSYYLLCDVCSHGWQLENREIEPLLNNAMRRNPIPFMDRLGFVSAIAIVAAFVGIAALLPPSQETIQAQRSYERLKTETQRDKNELTQLEQQISNIDTQIEAKHTAIATLEERITAIEHQYPNHQVPADIYDNYSKLIDDHNRLVTEYNDMVKKRTGLVDLYDAKVKAYNDEVRQLRDAKSKCGSSCD